MSNTKKGTRMNNEPVAWINKDEKEGWLNWDKNTNMPINIPLYTHQYERPHNTVLVPCDKLAEMQAEIERLIMLCDCMTTESNRKGNEIEELKAKLNKYHLKEDLDRNLDLIYGKEFIK